MTYENTWIVIYNKKAMRFENTVSAALRNATPSAVADIGKYKIRTVQRICLLMC